MMALDATNAAFRFGLGPRPGELEVIGSDPRDWLVRQMTITPTLPAALANVPTAADRIVAQLEAKGSEDKNKALSAGHRSDLEAHLTAAIVSDRPFVERLNRFWLNHFTLSISRPATRGILVPFEVEAVRPHLFGRFADLLIAVTSHQSMLLYLDNAYSFGPNSSVGRKKKKGLNENLGREILELHSLGVDGGYDQDDVRALALILTGWTVSRLNDPNPGAFRFFDQAHEPGEKRLLGQRFAEDGQDEGLAALEMLSIHPSTAKHLATKLARHFVADDPPPAVVETLAQVYLDNAGALLPVYRALIDLDAPWQTPLGKVKTPQELVIATRRATGEVDQGKSAFNYLRLLGQMPFSAPSPAGWSDRAEDWIGPEAMLNRIEWSYAAAGYLDDRVAPGDLLTTAVGGFADKDLAQRIARAPSKQEAIAFVLASSAFQRR